MSPLWSSTVKCGMSPDESFDRISERQIHLLITVHGYINHCTGCLLNGFSGRGLIVSDNICGDREPLNIKK